MKTAVVLLLVAQCVLGCASTSRQDTDIVAVQGRVLIDNIEVVPGGSADGEGGGAWIHIGGRIRTDIVILKVFFGTIHQKQVRVSMNVAGIPVVPYTALILLQKRPDGTYDALIWDDADQWCIRREDARALGIEQEMGVEIRKHPCRAGGTQGPEWNW